MDVRLRKLASEQADVVAGWQLTEVGWTRAALDDWVRRNRWRIVHPGVYALARAPLTREQLWMAATLSAPGTALAGASAGACWGFRPWEGSFEVVVRQGSGGPRRLGGLLVMRTRVTETTTRDGIPIITPERTLIDLAASLPARAIAKATREAIRLKATTASSLLDALLKHRGRRGTKQLRELAERYKGLPIERARSDAESYALERLGPGPSVNVRIAGEEADLVWHDERLIIEIDGPQYHLFPDEDERKERAWRAAGYEVIRRGSDAVFSR
jgi:hypothetical protein